jgi:hypothetical protein
LRLFTAQNLIDLRAESLVKRRIFHQWLQIRRIGAGAKQRVDCIAVELGLALERVKAAISRKRSSKRWKSNR